MKPNSILIVILSLCVLTACQSTKTHIKGVKKISDIEKMDLNGPIKSLKVKSYRISINTQTGKINYIGLSKIDAKNLSYSFDENGNITEKRSYDEKEELGAKYTYTYDHNKRQIIEKTYRKSEEEPEFKQVDYYDKNGNKTKLLSYSKGEDRKPYKEVYNYDKNGNILEEIAYKSSGPFKTEYKYDKKDNLIEKTMRNPHIVMMKETYTYDTEGNLLTIKQDENRTVHAKYVNERKYKDGLESENKVLKDGQPDGRFMYTYNDQGDQIEYKKYDLDNNLLFGEKTDFEYDDKNNWVRKIPFDRNGAPKYLIQREIEYFEK